MRPDEARADVVDVEERFSERQRDPALVLPLPVQVVMARARQCGPPHHHDDYECPSRYKARDQESQRGDVRGSDNPRYRVKRAVVLSQSLLGELVVHLMANRRKQASFVAIIESWQIRRRVELRLQQEGRHPQLGEYVLLGEAFNLVPHEDLLQPSRIPVILGSMWTGRTPAPAGREAPPAWGVCPSR